MKIYCGNAGCTRSTHSLTLRVGVTGIKKEEGWFCSHRCYKNFNADNLIVTKRAGSNPVSGMTFSRVARRLKLGFLLVKNKLINKEQLTRALEQKSGSLKKLGEILVDMKMITTKELKAALSMQSGIPPVNLDPLTKIPLKEEIPFKLIHEFHFVVFKFDEEDKTIAIAVYDMDYIDLLTHYFSKTFPKYTVTCYLEDRAVILSLISANYPEEKFNLDLEDQLEPPAALGEAEDIEKTILHLVEFFNKYTGNPVKVDSLDKAVWLKNETDTLKFDVYITKKAATRRPLEKKSET